MYWTTTPILKTVLLVIFNLSCILACRPFIPDFISGYDEGCGKFVCDKNSPYRTFDGSCNNLKRPSWGTPNTTYATFINESYPNANGTNGYPLSSANGSLPNPRELSLAIFPIKETEDPVWTMLTMIWGQTIAHDLSNTAGVSPKPGYCCRDGKYTAKQKSDPKCASIPIPSDDPINGPAGNVCYDFYRTDTNEKSSCKADKPYQPLTDVTGYMDVSLVYGSDAAQAKDLRAFEGGRLLSDFRNGQEWPPQSHDAKATCDYIDPKEKPCYRAGDVRVNQNSLLSVLQTIFMREHNRIANYLYILNPHWSDEICFQEARKIFIAEMQWINYYEFLPIYLGRVNMINGKLIYPGTVGYTNDYNPEVNPSVAKEFATASFRRFHSSIPGTLKFYSENRKEIRNSTRLSDHMNRPSVLEAGDNFNLLTRACSTQSQNLVSTFYSKEVKDYMFKDERGHYGVDLRSLDIQRAREHGLCTYVEAMAACGLPEPKSFEDFTKFIPPPFVAILQKYYKSYKDVELPVGGSLENHLPGTMVGPTDHCIMMEQFSRCRKSDRFLFENDKTMTLDQINTIRTSSVAAMLCNNADIEQMQPQAFLKISLTNNLVPCNKLPQMNLDLWKDKASSTAAAPAAAAAV